MPMHDWSRSLTETYHNFHVLLIAALTHRLNHGLLPAGCYAMAEQDIGGPVPDVVTLRLNDVGDSAKEGGVAIAVPAHARPQASVVMQAEDELYSSSTAVQTGI